MWILVGYQRVAVILGMKYEDCGRCHQIARHVLARRLWWFTIFRIPVLPFMFDHGLLCTVCGEWTGVSALQAWSAARAGTLPLERPRPDFEALPPQDPNGNNKPPASAFFDPIEINKETRGVGHLLESVARPCGRGSHGCRLAAARPFNAR